MLERVKKEKEREREKCVVVYVLSSVPLPPLSNSLPHFTCATIKWVFVRKVNPPKNTFPSPKCLLWTFFTNLPSPNDLLLLLLLSRLNGRDGQREINIFFWTFNFFEEKLKSLKIIQNSSVLSKLIWGHP